MLGRQNERGININCLCELAEPYHANQFVTGGVRQGLLCLTFRHRASCILGQAFRYSPENAFYIFNQQIYFII